MSQSRVYVVPDLALSTLEAANMARLPLFRNGRGELAHSKPDGSDWTPLEWCGAILGELGELANLLKKVKRGDVTMKQAQQAIADELADVQTYLSITARQCGVDLGPATIFKFNRVSIRVGCGIRITDPNTWADIHSSATEMRPIGDIADTSP